MANAIKYIKNVAKSAGYMAVDIVGEMSPGIASFTKTNEELGKELYESVKDIKGTAKKVQTNIMGSDVYEFASAFKKNLFEDLKSGNFYNKTREREYEEKLMQVDDESLRAEFADSFGDDEDFDMGDDWLNSNDDDDGDLFLAESFDEIGEKIANSNAEVTIRSSEYIVAGQKESTKVLYDQNNRLFAKALSGMAAMNSNIGQLTGLPEALQTHANNSSRFFERTGKSLDEMNASLKEIANLLRPSTAVKDAAGKKSERLRYDDMTDENGMVDIKQYLAHVKKNISEESGISDFTDMLGNGENTLLAFAASPIKQLTEGFIKKQVPKILKESMGQFDNSLQGLFGSLISKINGARNSDNPIIEKLANIFGVNVDSKSSVDTSKYEKGKVDWDGIARKSLVEVIPGQLSQIVSLLSGEPAKIYDYNKGRFIDVRAANDSVKGRKESSARMATYDVRKEFDKYLNNLQFENINDRQELDQDIDRFFNYMYDNGGMINFNDKRKMQEIGLGQYAETLIPMLFAQLKKNGKGYKALKINGDIMSARNREARNLRNEELKGDGIYNILANGLYDSQLKEDPNTISGYRQDERLDRTHSLFDQIDNHGNNIFYYLQGMYQFQEWMVYNWNMGTSGGKKNRNRRYISSTGMKVPDGSIEFNRVFDNITRIKETEAAKNREAREKEEERYNRYNDRARDNDKNNLIYRSQGFMDEDERANIQQFLDHADEVEKDLNMTQKEKDAANADGKDLTFLQRLSNAESLNDKVKVLGKGAISFINKPMEAFAKLLDSASDNMYKLIYGEAREEDEDLGIFGLLKKGISTQFENMNNWIEDHVLKPLAEKTGINAPEDIARKVFGWFGKDYDDVKERWKGHVKENIFGEYDAESGVRTGGLLGDYIQETKETAKSAFDWMKQGVKDVTEPIRDKFNDITDNYRAKQYAEGGTVQETGMAAVSKGELIIPSELNPFYHGKTDKKQQIKDEKKAIKKFYGNYSGGGTVGEDQDVLDEYGVEISDNEAEVGVTPAMVADYINKKIETGKFYTQEQIKKFAKSFINKKYNELKKTAQNKIKQARQDAVAAFGPAGTYVNGAGEVMQAGASYMGEVTGELANAAKATLKGLGFDINTDKQGKELFDSVLGEAKSAAPSMTVGGGIGLIAGTLVGGPLLGAGLGAAIGLVKKSDKVSTMLFGEKTEDGYTGAMFSKDVADFMTQKVPEMAKYGLTGTMASFVLPGGPVAGAIIGASIPLVKDSLFAKELFFGEGEEGDMKKKAFEEKVQKALPKMGAGAIGGLLFGPFGGIVSNLMLGAAIGFASDSNAFKDAIFGKEIDGERRGGLLQNIRMGIIDPFAGFVKDEAQGIKDWLKKDIMDPLTNAVPPLLKAMELGGKGFMNVAKKFLGIGVNKVKKSNFGDWLLNRGLPARFVRNVAANAVSAPISMAKGLISLPFKALGGLGNAARASQISTGNADYMTAEERLNWRRENGMGADAVKAFDNTVGTFKEAGKNFKKGHWLEGIGGSIKGVASIPTGAGGWLLSMPGRAVRTINDVEGKWEDFDKNLAAMSDTDVEELRQVIGNLTDVKGQAEKDKVNIAQKFQDRIATDYAIPLKTGKKIVKYITSDNPDDHAKGLQLIADLEANGSLTAKKKQDYLDLANDTMTKYDEANKRLANEQSTKEYAQNVISDKYSWFNYTDEDLEKYKSYLDTELRGRKEEGKIDENGEDVRGKRIEDLLENDTDVKIKQHAELIDQLKVITNALYVANGRPDKAPYADEEDLSVSMDDLMNEQNEKTEYYDAQYAPAQKRNKNVYERATERINGEWMIEQQKYAEEHGGLTFNEDTPVEEVDMDIYSDTVEGYAKGGITQKDGIIAISKGEFRLLPYADQFGTSDNVESEVGDSSDPPNGEMRIKESTMLGGTVLKVWNKSSQQYEVDRSDSDSLEALDDSKKLLDSLTNLGNIQAQGINPITQQEEEKKKKEDDEEEETGSILKELLSMVQLPSGLASILGKIKGSWLGTLIGPLALGAFLTGKLDAPIASLVQSVEGILGNLLGWDEDTIEDVQMNSVASGEDGEQSYLGNAAYQVTKNTITQTNKGTLGGLFTKFSKGATNAAKNTKGMKKITNMAKSKLYGLAAKPFNALDSGIKGLQATGNEKITNVINSKLSKNKANEIIGDAAETIENNGIDSYFESYADDAVEKAADATTDTAAKTADDMVDKAAKEATNYWNAGTEVVENATDTASKAADTATNIIKNSADDVTEAVTNNSASWTTYVQQAAGNASDVKDAGSLIREGLSKTVDNTDEIIEASEKTNALNIIRDKVTDWWGKIVSKLPGRAKDCGDEVVEGIMKVMDDAVEEGAKSGAKATGKAGSKAIPVIGWIETAGFAIIDYNSGYNQAAAILGIEDPSDEERTMAGALNSLIGVISGLVSATGIGIAIGIAIAAIPTKMYATVLANTIGKALGTDILEKRKKYTEKINTYNDTYSKSYDTEQYEKTVKNETGWFGNLKNNFSDTINIFKGKGLKNDTGLDEDGNAVDEFLDQNTIRWDTYYAPKIAKNTDLRPLYEAMYLNECLHDSYYMMDLGPGVREKMEARLEELKKQGIKVPEITRDLDGLIQYGRVQEDSAWWQKVIQGVDFTQLGVSAQAQEDVDYGNGTSSESFRKQETNETLPNAQTTTPTTAGLGSAITVSDTTYNGEPSYGGGHFANGGYIGKDGVAALSKGEFRIPPKFFGQYANGGTVGEASQVGADMSKVFSSISKTMSFSKNDLDDITDMSDLLKDLATLNPEDTDWDKYWSTVDNNSKKNILHPLKAIFSKMTAMMYLPIFSMQKSMTGLNSSYTDSLTTAMSSQKGTTGSTTSTQDSTTNNSSSSGKSSGGLTGVFSKIGNSIKKLFGGASGIDESELSAEREDENPEIAKRSGKFISQLESGKAYGDSDYASEGCAPASAAMLINSVTGDNVSMEDAGNYAEANGYTGKGGTSADYFGDIFSQHGLDSEYTDSKSSIKDNLRQGKPTVLLGQDSSNTSKKDSPFGKSDHYVVATGMDSNGRVKVNDPESSTPGQTYDSSILNNVSLGVSVGKGSGIYKKANRDINKSNKIFSKFRNKYGGASKDYLGKLVKRFESGSRGSLAMGPCGNDGGCSFGSYQLTIRWGNAYNFLKKYYKNDLNGLTQGSSVDKYKEVWTACYNKDPDKFFTNEHAHIKAQYYDNIVRNLKGFYTPDNRAMQECLWSWSVHRGATNATNEFKQACKDAGISNPQKADKTKLFEACYKKRYSIFVNNRYKLGYSDSEPETLRPYLSKPCIDDSGSLIAGTGGEVSSSSDSVSSTASTDAGSKLDNAFKKLLSGIYGTKLTDTVYGLYGESGSTTDTTSTESNSNKSDSDSSVDSLEGSEIGKAVAKDAAKYIGGKYVWGGNDLNTGVDCSGFVTQLYKKHGYNIPNRQSTAMFKDTSKQGGKTLTVPYNQLQPGDAMFFSNNGQASGVHHVGIYAGNGQMIHAQSTKTGIVKTDMNSSSYYKGQYIGAKRYGAGSGLELNPDRMVTDEQLFAELENYYGSGSKSKKGKVKTQTGSLAKNTNTGSIVKKRTVSKPENDYTALLKTIAESLSQLVENTSAIATIAKLVGALAGTSEEKSAGGTNTTGAVKANTSLNEDSIKSMVSLLTSLSTQ